MTRAVYAGSFDPITNGHLWMIREAAKLFQGLVVAVGDNPQKRCMFSVEQRIGLIWDNIDAGLRRSVSVDVVRDMFLVDYARDRLNGCSHMVRGIRGQEDVAFERTMRHINADIAPNISTVFLMPPRDLSEVSSSMVKGLVGPAGWEDVVGKYVPANVLLALRERLLGAQ